MTNIGDLFFLDNQSVLGIIPDVLFLVFAFPRLYRLWFQPFKLNRYVDLLLIVKIWILLLIVGAHAAQLALVNDTDGLKFPGSLPSTIVALLATACHFYMT